MITMQLLTKIYTYTRTQLLKEQSLYFLRIIIGTTLYYLASDYLRLTQISGLLKSTVGGLLFATWIYSFLA